MNIRPSEGRRTDFSNACRNVPPTWTETSYSYSVCRDVNTHTGIECCVMYRSSFRTFPSFLIPRAHSAHNMLTTLWSFRSFSSKPQSSFILSTKTEQWKFHTESLHISKTKYPDKLWFHCPLTIKKSVSQKSRLFFIEKIYHKQIDTGKQNRCTSFLQGETST